MRLNRPVTPEYIEDLAHSLGADPALIRTAVHTGQLHLAGHAAFDKVTLDGWLKKHFEREAAQSQQTETN